MPARNRKRVAWCSRTRRVPDAKRGIPSEVTSTARAPWPLLAAIFLSAWKLTVPHYHFNWDLGSQRVRDEVGVELTDDDTARQHADAHRELLLAAFSVERHYDDYGIEVCGPNGEMLFRISLR
jgi:hypothetical protein